VSYDEESRIRELAELTGIPECVLRGSFMAPEVTLPAPACPAWCGGGHGWEWAGLLTFVALHSHDFGAVQDVTVSVCAEEVVTIGDLPVFTVPAVRLWGEAERPFTVAQACRLAGLLVAAGSLLAVVGGQR
jgi:hypothetical protein